VCLISAHYFHHLTTKIPHYLYIALPKGSPQTKLDYPALQVIRLSGRAMTSGIETHTVDGEHIRVFSVAKTVANCFRFRNKIGIDVAVEALREAIHIGKVTPAPIDEIAKVSWNSRIDPWHRGFNHRFTFAADTLTDTAPTRLSRPSNVWEDCARV